MSRPFRASPCCRVRSQVLLIDLERKMFTLRCSSCGAAREEPMRDEEAQDPPRLFLIVNNTELPNR